MGGRTRAGVYKEDEILVWPILYAESRTRDPYVDGQRRVWFVRQRGNYVAYLQVVRAQ
jgi:hypothetical protein